MMMIRPTTCRGAMGAAMDCGADCARGGTLLIRNEYDRVESNVAVDIDQPSSSYMVGNAGRRIYVKNATDQSCIARAPARATNSNHHDITSMYV